MFLIYYLLSLYFSSFLCLHIYDTTESEADRSSLVMMAVFSTLATIVLCSAVIVHAGGNGKYMYS